MDPAALWKFLPAGYLLTVLIETPVLLAGLSPEHSVRRRLLAGLWLTACTYPVVVLVLPLLVPPAGGRPLYLLVAETFAPAAECLLLAAAFHGPDTPRSARVRDFTAVTGANLLSFLAGEVIHLAGGGSYL